jgi:hypothetical protein
METLRVLCIHGIGHGDTDPQLVPSWTDAITTGIRRWNPDQTVDCEFLFYDDIFAGAPLDAGTIAEALAKLSWSGAIHGLGDLLGLSRDIGGLQATLRWTAGMVAQWADDADLRAEARQQVLAKTKEVDPNIIVAHSLGSLISYDAFARKENAGAIDGRYYISLGSQVGNPFVRNALGGRIVMMQAREWFHLYNLHDKAFAAQIRLTDENFEQVPTPFDVDFLDHDAIRYLSHPNTINTVWRELAPGSATRALVKRDKAVSRAVAKPPQRALLIGINDYPDPANRLEGCVNDVFEMSAVLQECGFAPENIRVVLNDRATAAGIMERLAWLLEGAQDTADRVLFYSGHGAQIPQYGEKEEVDHLDECLVPWDFDWTREKAITDTQFHELYSQLPETARFLTVFDCCHSGGMTRDGGPRVRGLTPPDDIRHRLLKWNAKEGMWEERKLEPDNPDSRKWAGKGVPFAGENGATRKLGRAMDLRTLPDKQYNAMRDAFGDDHFGPFLPVILEACQDNQLSYEYRHGVTSYGAFTWVLTHAFRESCKRARHMSWEQLIRDVSRKLERMKYAQTPVLVGPGAVINKPIPWQQQGNPAKHTHTHPN